jgi:glycosyltransferase involved in cell wall biosynthesis
LSEYLNAASSVFAVSQAFAELYSRALENSPIAPPVIEVLANDWQSYPCGSARSPQEPVRFAFIGGWSVHKGAAVLKEALASVKARNLELTIIDYGLGKGEVRKLEWGGLDVCFTGPRALGEMAEFYGSLDVLLAPSIWPESFGLVTREALSAGVWVIGSDVGALAEPIEQGVNGSVIPARDPRALAEAIEFAASPAGAAARAGWRAQAGIWLRELPRSDNLATLHRHYGELTKAQ